MNFDEPNAEAMGNARRAIVKAAIKWNELYDSSADDDSNENVAARLRLSEAVERYKELANDDR